MRHLFGIKSVLVAMVAFAVFAGLAMIAEAAPRKVATAKAGQCSVCHGKENVLPSEHPDTRAMSYFDCLGCHTKQGPQKLEGKIPASHIHGLSGVTCIKCHGKAKKQEAVEMKQCVACHNAEKLKEKTEKVKPENPHTSPHYGTSLDCNLCHHQHAKSENYCAQCHKFDFVVP